MKASNNSGTGLEIALPIVGGGSVALYLISHPSAPPHYWMAWAMYQVGHPISHLARVGVGAGLVAAIIFAGWMCIEGKIKGWQRVGAIRKATQDAERDDKLRAKLKGVAQVDTQAVIDSPLATATGEEQPTNRATLGFVLGMMAGAAAIFAAAYFFFV